MNRISPPRHQGHQAHPTTRFEPRRTRRAQSRPPTLQRRGAEPQSRRVDLVRFLYVAMSRPSDGREPLSRDTAPNTSVRHGVPTQRLAFLERKPRHFSSSFNRWEGHAPSPTHEREERQNRRATGTSATGDFLIACRSAGIPRSQLTSSAMASLHLCVFAGRVEGWALRSLRFINGWAGGSVPSVSLWFISRQIPRIG